jgi:CheY-like chemotaxis protein
MVNAYFDQFGYIFCILCRFTSLQIIGRLDCDRIMMRIMDVAMFRKRSPKKDLEQKIQQFEKEAFERGLVEHMPPAKESDRFALSGKAADRLKYLLTIRRSKNRPRILIIDDEVLFRQMLCQFLTQSGYEVIEAADGQEGVRLFFEMPADVVISDVIMPEKEGIETVVEIKRQFPNAKIIIMSGGGWYGTEIDFDMAKKLGAVTLKKPFELQELSQAIDKLLN